MKEITIMLNNIQSHKNTVLQLKPGLNFILADDNNVGKSTIFNAITTAVRMPKVSSEDLIELLRVKENQGYIAFIWDDIKVIFWLIRTDKKVHAFFELHSNGNIVRYSDCPHILLEALDIVIGQDGTPLNFNDADSVQLIVQDSMRNDEVLSKVLIDLRVEDIKSSLTQLDKRVVEDYRRLVVRCNDTNSLLSQLSYNQAVDNFKDEKVLLDILAYLMDNLDKSVEFTEPSFQMTDEVVLDSVIRCLSALDVLDSMEWDTKERLIQLDYETSAYEILQHLQLIDLKSMEINPISESILQNLGIGISTLDTINKSVISCGYIDSAEFKLERMLKDIAAVSQEISDRSVVVECPIKGEVYFSDEQCIPTGN